MLLKNFIIKQCHCLILLLIFTFYLTNCSGLNSTSTNEYDTIVVKYERPSQEALADFKKFLANNNLEISSINNNTIQTEPSKLGAQQYSMNASKTKEIKIMGLLKSSGDESSISVKAEYQDPSSGEWKNAKYTGDDLRATYSYEVYFKQLHQLLVIRYGNENIDVTN